MIASTASSEQSSFVLSPVDEAIHFNLILCRYRVADHVS
jgi:hypothetical protein